MYADYAFYIAQYYGTKVDEASFPALATKASAYLDYYTMGKAKANPELVALKMACCALVDKFLEIDKVSAAAETSAFEAVSVGKKSESVGAYSVTYQSVDELKTTERILRGELPGIARMYLTGTGLLYRGGGCGCTHPTL